MPTSAVTAPGAQSKPLVIQQHPVEPGTDRKAGVSPDAAASRGPHDESVVNQSGSSTNIVSSSGVKSMGSLGRAKERVK